MKQLLVVLCLFLSVTLSGQTQQYNDLVKQLQSTNNDTSKVKVLLNLANDWAANSSEQRRERMVFALQAFQLSEKLQSKKDMANSLYYVGNLFIEKHNYGTAQEKMEQAKTIIEGTDDKALHADILSQLGYINGKRRHNLEAVEHMQAAISLYEQTGEKSSSEVRCYVNLARECMRQKAYVDAKKNAEKGLAIAEAINNKKGIYEATKTLGKVQKHIH